MNELSTKNKGLFFWIFFIIISPFLFAVDVPLSELDSFFPKEESLFTPSIISHPTGRTLAFWLNEKEALFNIQMAERNEITGQWTAPTELLPEPSSLEEAQQKALRVITSWQEDPSLGRSLQFIFQPLPPSNFRGYSIKNEFITQTDYIHRLRWDASTDPTVAGYQILRNGVLLINVLLGEGFVYDDHNRHKNETDVYTLMSFDQFGILSTPLTVTVYGRNDES